jgi:redox-sensitive bicupin YhaK (pirin superfamily)
MLFRDQNTENTMLTIRKSNERGRARFSWLDSAHTFSFGEYYDPQHMGFGKLRVINEDVVAPGGGFATHGHRDMEIISYVLDGALEHKDSMGNGSVIQPGDVQRMSAGTGVTHSEYNHSKSETVRFLQIWFLPDRKGHEPGYEQKHFEPDEKRGRLKLVASRSGREGSVSLNQDVDMFVALLDGEETARHELAADRSAWIQVANGSVEVNGRRLEPGDGAALNGPVTLELGNGHAAEVILFDQAGHG